MRFNPLLLMAAIVLLAVGCGGKLSQHAIDSAKKALEAAKNAEADRYDPGKFNEAKSLYEAAWAEANRQKEITFSDYSKARKLFLSARDAANKAKSNAAKKKKAVKKETENLLAKISKELKGTNRLLSKVVEGQEADSTLKPVKDQIKVTEDSVSEVKALLKAGDYLDARIRAEAIISQIASYQKEIQKEDRD